MPWRALRTMLALLTISAETHDSLSSRRTSFQEPILSSHYESDTWIEPASDEGQGTKACLRGLAGSLHQHSSTPNRRKLITNDFRYTPWLVIRPQYEGPTSNLVNILFRANFKSPSASGEKAAMRTVNRGSNGRHHSRTVPIRAHPIFLIQYWKVIPNQEHRLHGHLCM